MQKTSIGTNESNNSPVKDVRDVTGSEIDKQGENGRAVDTVARLVDKSGKLIDHNNPLFFSLIPISSVDVFGSVTSVVTSALTVISTYTVPIAKIFYFNLAEVSGSNIAEFTVLIDDIIVAKKRSYFPNFNLDFNFFMRNIAAGSKIDIKVIHTRPHVGDFEARILGQEIDV